MTVNDSFKRERLKNSGTVIDGGGVFQIHKMRYRQFWCCLNLQLPIQKLPPLPMVWVSCSWIDTDGPVEDAKAQSTLFRHAPQ